MQNPVTIYSRCDELEALPPINRENWKWETVFITETLEKNARVLQIGSANGSRLATLKKRRPDLSFLGIDIEEKFIDIANELFEKEGIEAKTIFADITSTKTIETLGTYDWVLCLNHTLGYIPDQEAALRNMRKLGKKVLISVYGKQFDNAAAERYFKTLALNILSMNEKVIVLQDFVNIRRYTRKDVEAWNGKIIDTPLGYACILSAPV